MTSRVEELQRMCDNINEHGGLAPGEWHTALLAQIAQNLAVIADVMMADRKTEPFDKDINVRSKDEQKDMTMEFTKREYQQFYHGISMSLLSKKSAQKWRYDDETAEEIRFLEGLESKVLDKIRQADTPQTDVYDYKGNGKWERSER